MNIEINPKRIACILMSVIGLLMIANFMAMIFLVTLGYGTAKGFVPMFLLNRIGIHEDVTCSPSLFSYRLYQACK